MSNLFKYLKKPSLLYFKLSAKGFFKNVPDDIQIKRLYKIKMGKKLSLSNPQTFNEKLQWLKLNDQKDIYTKLVDKYEVKKYLENVIGKQYIIPTIGVYEKFDDIDFDKLPNQFVIKCTHDSGGVFICKDKTKINMKLIKKKINQFLKREYYYIWREWPYRNVKPRIIIEKYMSCNNEDLQDFKVHNFNGIPKIILVCKDRYKKSGLTEDFFDVEWNHLDIRRPNHGNSINLIPKPDKLDEILELSKKVSKEIPFVRTDFYIVNDKVYFGEITFFPASGFEKFIPEEWDMKLGSYIDLPK